MSSGGAGGLMTADAESAVGPRSSVTCPRPSNGAAGVCPLASVSGHSYWTRRLCLIPTLPFKAMVLCLALLSAARVN
jgi:hypothetical protein